MKLGLIVALIFVPTIALAEPVEGPMRGSTDIEAGEQVIQPVDLLGGEPTLFVIRGEGGQIDCTLATIEGEPIAIDTDPDSNECVFRVTPEETTTILLLVRNNGDETASVTAIAR